MPQLQTTVNILTPGFQIGYNDTILLFGSCFAESIGNRLLRNKFKTEVNPFGVLYNPASITENLNLLFEKKQFTEANLNFYNSLWFSFNHHSNFSSKDKNECLNKINSRLSSSKQSIKSSTCFIFTLGTSWIYRLKGSNNVVANCHKLPDKNFIREFLSPEQTVKLFKPVLEKLVKQNSQVKFVFTVSPIRHWKDGAIENARSKASLIMAIKELENSFSNLYYFPVYEIFMDEMRDYRYYAADMLHPSDFAIDYVWEKFADTFFSTDTKSIIKEVDKLLKSFEHKPLSPESTTYNKFIQDLKTKAEKLSGKYPGISFNDELLRITP
jgi:hypothetical protein